MSVTIQHTVPLAPYTTFGIGGAAEFFVSVRTVDALREACQWAVEQQCPITLLGHGSNVLIADTGVRGLVIHIAIDGVSYADAGDAAVDVTAGAGVLFDDLVEETVGRGLWGLENLSAIPSSVGAAPVQNIGAYGAEVSSCIHEVTVFDTKTHEVRSLVPDECQFGYRTSLFKTDAGVHLVVVAVTFRLSKEGTPNIAYHDLATYFADSDIPTVSEIRNAVIAIRSGKFPAWTELGNAGSFFKNPVIGKAQYASLVQKYDGLPGFETADGQIKTSSAWILDHVLHMKGVQHGRVGTYSKQPLVLINHGGATAADIETFAAEIVARVQEVCAITLEWEVTALE